MKDFLKFKDKIFSHENEITIFYPNGNWAIGFDFPQQLQHRIVTLYNIFLLLMFAGACYVPLMNKALQENTILAGLLLALCYAQASSMLYCLKKYEIAKTTLINQASTIKVMRYEICLFIFLMLISYTLYSYESRMFHLVIASLWLLLAIIQTIIAIKIKRAN